MPAERSATDAMKPAASSQTFPAEVEAGVVPRVAAVGSTHSYTPRIDAAVAALRRSPDISAASLADVLRDGGHRVSVRTAQRIKADALAQLAASREA